MMTAAPGADAAATTTEPVERQGAWRALVARRPSLVLTVANVSSQAVSFINGLIVARQLGTVGRGEVGLVQAYDEVSTDMLSLGTSDATAYLAKEHVDTEARILGAALKISLVSTPITAVIGWLVAHFLFADYPKGVQLAAWTAIGMTPLTNAYWSACRMLLVSRGQIHSLAPLSMLSMLARLGSMVVLIATGHFNASTCAFAFVFTGWLGNFLGWRAVKVRHQWGGPVRPMLVYGIKTVPASLASMANSRLDQLLVAPLLSASALGIYSVAIGVNVIPVAAGIAIAQAGYHTVIGTKGDSVGGGRVLRRAAIAMAAISVVSAIGIALLLEPVYGPAFHDSVIPALILVPGSAFTGVFLVAWSTGNAIGDPALAAKAQLAGLVVTVIGLPLLLPHLGVPGAALVSTGSYAVRLLVSLWLLRRHGVTMRS